MTDIKNTKLLWSKGILFVLIGVGASALLLLEAPSLKIGLLWALTVWAFCRAYYFAIFPKVDRPDLNRHEPGSQPDALPIKLRPTQTMFASAEGAGIEPARLSLSRLPTFSHPLSGSPSVVCLQ